MVGSLGKSRERVGGWWWWGWIWDDPDEDAGESGGGGEEDAEIILPHLGGCEALRRPPTRGISEGEGEESRVYQRRPPLEYEGERRKVREGESEGERRDSAEDMGISPT